MVKFICKRITIKIRITSDLSNYFRLRITAGYRAALYIPCSSEANFACLKKKIASSHHLCHQTVFPEIHRQNLLKAFITKH